MCLKNAELLREWFTAQVRLQPGDLVSLQVISRQRRRGSDYDRQYYLDLQLASYNRILIDFLAGLFALLLIVLEWIRPGLPTPLRPICDKRVLNHFIKEARDAEAAMKFCKEECSIAVPLTVPLTRVDFDVWEKKNTEEQAEEVQTGLWLLNMAISSLGASINNAALQSHIDASVRNIASLKQVLRSLSIQDYVHTDGGKEETWRVSSASELFQVHINFLRGKVRLLLDSAPACQQHR